MKIYVITAGEYSDYQIVGVSDDKNKAQAICASLNRGSPKYINFYQIEEYDTDDIQLYNTEKPNSVYKMCISYKTSEIKWILGPGYSFDKINETYVFISCNRKFINITATFPNGTTEEKAKKIMLDRVAKFKAERQGL